MKENFVRDDLEKNVKRGPPDRQPAQLGVDLGVKFVSIWGRFGAKLGPIWGRFGVDLGSIWDRLGTDLGSVWGRFGVGSGSVRGRFGKFWGKFADILSGKVAPCMEHVNADVWQ